MIINKINILAEPHRALSSGKDSYFSMLCTLTGNGSPSHSKDSVDKTGHCEELNSYVNGR